MWKYYWLCSFWLCDLFDRQWRWWIERRKFDFKPKSWKLLSHTYSSQVPMFRRNDKNCLPTLHNCWLFFSGAVHNWSKLCFVHHFLRCHLDRLHILIPKQRWHQLGQGTEDRGGLWIQGARAKIGRVAKGITKVAALFFDGLCCSLNGK